MDHDARWSAVVVDIPVEGLIRFVAHKGKAIIGKTREFVWPSDGKNLRIETAPAGLFYAAGPVGFCDLVLQHPEEKEKQFITGYPVPLQGIPRNVTIRDLQEECMGLEAKVTAVTEGGLVISFFAIDYFMDPDRYRRGTHINVSLSGIVYFARAPETEKIKFFNVSDPDFFISNLHGDRGEVPGTVYLRPEDAVCMSRIEGAEPFDYHLRGPIKDIEPATENTLDLFSFTASGAFDRDDDLEIALVAHKTVLQDFDPVANSAIVANISLMGQATDFRWPS